MTSPNKDRFPVTPKYYNSLKGLKFFSLKNSKGSSVIPSTKNFLDNFQIKKIKCDDEATTTVLPIQNVAMLNEIFQIYSSKCSFCIMELRSVGGITLALVLSERFSQPLFQFRIGYNNNNLKIYIIIIIIGLDIFPSSIKINKNLNPSFEAVNKEFPDSDIPIGSTNCYDYEYFSKTTSVNFFLCSEDIEYILNNANLLEAINFTHRCYVKQYSQYIPRRNSALLGSDFLGLPEHGGGISFSRVKLYFDSSVHKLQDCSWDDISEIVLAIVGMRYLKTGSIDFEILDSIEPNDILGFIGDDSINPYDDEHEV